MQHVLYVSVLCFQLLISHCHSTLLPFLGANLTANVDRIKIVFTPMVCRRICHGGQCYNNCERGDKTTVYSENQGPPTKKHGFRLCKCLIIWQFVRFFFSPLTQTRIGSEFLTRVCFVFDEKVVVFFEMHWNETFCRDSFQHAIKRVKEREKIGSVIAHWDLRGV